MTRIIVDNVSHSFEFRKQSLPVLHNLSFEVLPMEVVSILGPSGCGKSTLLRCLAGLLSPTEGTIRFDGKPPEVLRREKKLGFGFQEPSLMDWRTVEENISLPVELGNDGVPSADSSHQADELLDMIQMKKYRHHYPSQLSGGMKHRTALARALILKPQVLLLDEPLAGLDLLTRKALMLQISMLLERQQCTTVVVTHSIEEAVFWSDRIILFTDRPATITETIIHNKPKPQRLDYTETAEFHKLVDECSKVLLRIT